MEYDGLCAINIYCKYVNGRKMYVCIYISTSGTKISSVIINLEKRPKVKSAIPGIR